MNAHADHRSRTARAKLLLLGLTGPAVSLSIAASAAAQTASTGASPDGAPVTTSPSPVPPAATDAPAPAPPAAASVTSPPPASPAPISAAPPPYPAAPPTAEPPTAPRAAPEPEPQVPRQDASVYEPPLPRAHRRQEASPAELVPPPPQPKHLAPRSSFWVGARPGVLFPLGSMWLDGQPVGELCCVDSVRPFGEFAGPGPSLGLDAGVRFGRHYQAFLFWERAWLSSGALHGAFGGQEGAISSMFGGGFRFNTHPDALGMILELGLGYRTFEAEWQSGTRLAAADDLFSTRVGFGAGWRLNELYTIELLALIGGGSFTDIEWTFADGSKQDALTAYDRYGQYIPLGIQFAFHWDVVGSDD